jgi:hypothetical protein
MTTHLALLLCMLAADPPKAAPAPNPPPDTTMKLAATPRAGYALVAVDAKEAPKQVEYLVTASGTSSEITYDQAGNTLIVTLPPTGSVVVHAVVLLPEGTLKTLPSLELSKQPATALTAAGKLAVTLVVNTKAMAAPERALLGSQVLKQNLTAAGHTWLFTDFSAPGFQQALAKAAQVNPNLPKISEIPFLFVTDPAGNFVDAYRLTLGPDAAANVAMIADLFKRK